MFQNYELHGTTEESFTLQAQYLSELMSLAVLAEVRLKTGFEAAAPDASARRQRVETAKRRGLLLETKAEWLGEMLEREGIYEPSFLRSVLGSNLELQPSAGICLCAGAGQRPMAVVSGWHLWAAAMARKSWSCACAGQCGWHWTAPEPRCEALRESKCSRFVKDFTTKAKTYMSGVQS